MADLAVIYLRISDDRTGRQAGVGRQREDCEALATRLGLDVIDVFVDNDISAFDGSRRPEYEAMLRHVTTGVSRVVTWHLDRLYRRPRELEELLDLVEGRSVRIETVEGGPFDLNTHEGRLMARQFVAIAAYESGHKADRIVRALRQRAEAGEWHGPARYGYADRRATGPPARHTPGPTRRQTGPHCRAVGCDYHPGGEQTHPGAAGG